VAVDAEHLLRILIDKFDLLVWKQKIGGSASDLYIVCSFILQPVAFSEKSKHDNYNSEHTKANCKWRMG
jgi:hypothetical protein